MLITDVETFIVGNPWKNWLFVKLHTSEGVTGIGEGTLNGFAKTVEAAIHELKHLYIGMDTHDVETIALKMTRDVYSDGGQIQGSALAEVRCGSHYSAGASVSRDIGFEANYRNGSRP